ncbi:tryptophan halogenase [Sphingomonas gellani]|uniref:Tryptophan halogenase n=1 Tax=Sphingomonas gellani TaxID=1166340 RepID=A0A1H8AWD4_9SPHN|nr:tryptophan halogenase family protein [Sphingomonas gellani]SEM74995.1 tryptophan halogenase [Sphingomonas gellani]
MIEQTVIVGGGTAGWMAAAAIARGLGRHQRVTLIESDRIGTVGVGEATVPSIRDFNRYLGLDEDQFVSATGGTFKLGIEFQGWNGPGSRYFHPFGFLGPDTSGVDFHHLWLRHVADGGSRDLVAISPEASAARDNRFGRTTPHGALQYAFHIDAARYAALLREQAEANGVVRIEGEVIGVERDPATGDVAAVVLADSRRISADLFVDCSGFRAVLVGEALGSGYVDWSRWLPCDRAVAVPSTRLDTMPPFTRAEVRETGWQWRIPLQHRTGNGYVFASGFEREDDAVRALSARLDTDAIAEPRLLRFTAGHRRAPWSHNCVSLGLAAGFLEPLESTSIHLIQTAIIRLLALFPHRSIDTRLVERFNRDTIAEYEAVRDFVIAHYRTSDGMDTAFWAAVRDQSPPDSLLARLEAFTATGTILYERGDLFGPTNWLAVLTGQGLWPLDHHPIAAAMPQDAVALRLKQLRDRAAAMAASLPSHASFLMDRGVRSL